MNKVVLLLALFALTTFVWADDSSAPQTITVIQTGWGGEGIYISTIEGVPLDGCEKPVFFINPTNNILFKEMMTLVISAYHAGSKVKFRVSGCMSGRMNVIAAALVKD